MSQYVEVANQVLILKERGWTERNGFWSNPKYVSKNYRTGQAECSLYLFSFEQALKKEGLE